MKGIILAGGKGTRLYPTTFGISKQLIPVYNKPMIYYPLSVLMLANIKDILIITTPEDKSNYYRLLGDGQDFGINLQYVIQKEPRGLAEAFILGENFIGNDDVALILGDNIFYGDRIRDYLKKASLNMKNNKATIFGYKVKDPSRYGIVNFNSDGIPLSIQEKPKMPKSNFAVTGLYFYPNNVISKAKNVKPSRRGELEITSINQDYLLNNELDVELFGRGFLWLDTGTIESLHEAANLIQGIESRQGMVIACLEEISLNNNWLNRDEIKNILENKPSNTYYDYIKKLIIS